MAFFREVFSEDDGQGSASRIIMLVHALAGIGWVSFFVWKGDGHGAHNLPDAVTFSGVTAFVTAPYAINKLHAAVTAFSSPAK